MPINMAWFGSKSSTDAAQQVPSGPFNPFLNMPTLAMVDTFTEGLPPGAKHLQWAVRTPSCSRCINADRGNLGLADQEGRPPWLSKPGHLSFCRQVLGQG